MNVESIGIIATSALGGLAVLGLIFFAIRKPPERNGPAYLFSTRPSGLSTDSLDESNTSEYYSARGSESRPSVGGKRKSKRIKKRSKRV